MARQSNSTGLERITEADVRARIVAMSSDESEPEAFAQYVGSDEEPSHDDDDGSADGSTSGESDAQSEQDVQEARLQKSRLSTLSSIVLWC